MVVGKKSFSSLVRSRVVEKHLPPPREREVFLWFRNGHIQRSFPALIFLLIVISVEFNKIVIVIITELSHTTVETL